MYSRIAAMLLLAGLVCVTQQSAEAGGERGCPVESAMKRLPQIQYMVGTETTSCRKAATDLSNRDGGTPISFVLKQRFDNEADAIEALAEATEVFVTRFATPQTCAVSGKITIGGTCTQCSESAAATASLINDAISTVKVSWQVGNRKCDCPVEAKKLAASLNQPVTYVVNGQKTTCPHRQRLNVARAKYRAAVETVAKVNSKTTR